MVKETFLNKIKGSMRGIPEGAWWLWYDTVHNIIKSLININNTKLSENLTQKLMNVTTVEVTHPQKNLCTTSQTQA